MTAPVTRSGRPNTSGSRGGNAIQSPLPLVEPEFSVDNEQKFRAQLGDIIKSFRQQLDTLSALVSDVTGTGKRVLDTSPTINSPTLVTPVINSAAHVGGAWVADATWSLPALTLAGAISGGGHQINNVIIGASTPLAGSFTTVAASSSVSASIAPSSDWLFKNSSTPLALANNATYDLAAAGSGLVIFINASATACGAVIFCHVGVTAILSDPESKFSAASGTGSKINVYYNAGTGSYRIENKLGETLLLYVMALSARPAA